MSSDRIQHIINYPVAFHTAAEEAMKSPETWVRIEGFAFTDSTIRTGEAAAKHERRVWRSFVKAMQVYTTHRISRLCGHCIYTCKVREIQGRWQLFVMVKPPRDLSPLIEALENQDER